MPEHSNTSGESQAGTFFLGRYRVVDEIGVGGMASVYLARMDGPGGFQRWVAIKRIHPHLIEDEGFVNMFLDEARVAASISHPNVATVFDLGKTGESYWIAMEYLHGEPLREIMRRMDELGQPMPPEIATKIVSDAAEGLHAAHELTGKAGEKLNLVHRDVTPHNLFVTYEGSVKVVDFGIAKFSSRLAHTRAGTLKGKLAYMSPEQVHGESIDRRTDVFALGVVLWELTTGQRLFRMENDLETMAKVQECNVPRPSTLVRGYPLDLEKIVLKALAKSPAERFKTAYEFARALQALLVRRGHFVGSEDVKGYVRSIFKERIETREAHLRWASEVTQTISTEQPDANQPRDFPPESMRFETSGESRPRPAAGAPPVVRPAAGVPARNFGHGGPGSSSMASPTGILPATNETPLSYEDPTSQAGGGYAAAIEDEDGLNMTLIDRSKRDDRGLQQLPPVPFPKAPLLSERDHDAPPDLSGDGDDTEALPTKVMRSSGDDGGPATVRAQALPAWPDAPQRPLPAAGQPVLMGTPHALAANQAAPRGFQPPMPAGNAVGMGAVPGGAPQGAEARPRGAAPPIWLVAAASALFALVVVVAVFLFVAGRKPNGTPTAAASGRGAFRSARDAFLDAQRLGAIVPRPLESARVAPSTTAAAPTASVPTPPIAPTATATTPPTPTTAPSPTAAAPAKTHTTQPVPRVVPKASSGGFVSVVPACDKVLVNGKAIGSSPLMKASVPSGELNVKCVLSSGTVKAKTIYVDSGETKVVSSF